LDTVCYRKGFEDGLDVALRVLREQGDGAIGGLFELAMRVRLEKAGEILRAINGPLRALIAQGRRDQARAHLLASLGVEAPTAGAADSEK